jgi:branched-chain amino acid transport system substrate-binding protein
MYVASWVPDQQVGPIVDHFMKQYKTKTFFLIGSDYAFGRGMLAFTKSYIEKKGGKVVGDEYLPMDGSDWTPILSKLQAVKADAVITSTAGGAPNVTLTKQMRAAGIKIPYANLSVDEGTAKSMGPDADGIFIAGSYMSNLDTPANKKYIASMQKKFGADLKTPNDMSVPQYEAIYLYKAAVEKAGSVDSDKVVKELATVSFDGPRGKIQMNKQRHTPLTMYLGQVQKDGSVKILDSFANVDPGEQCPNLK